MRKPKTLFPIQAIRMAVVTMALTGHSLGGGPWRPTNVQDISFLAFAELGNTLYVGSAGNGVFSNRVFDILYAGEAIILATEKGIFRTGDYGRTWLAPSGDSPSKEFHSLATSGKRILAGSGDSGSHDALWRQAIQLLLGTSWNTGSGIGWLP